MTNDSLIRGIAMNWWIVANSIFACGNFWFAGYDGDKISLSIGVVNLLCVLIEASNWRKIA